jgi:hypothetical protein
MYRLHSQRRRRLPGRKAAPIALAVLCLLLRTREEAFALSLLSIRDFHHSVGAGYNYSDSQSSEGGVAHPKSQTIRGDYYAGFDYFILSPRLWKGNSSLGLEWLRDSTQDSTGSSSTSFLQLNYNITGQILPQSDVPSSFSSSSTRQTVTPTFTPLPLPTRRELRASRRTWGS